VDDPRSRPGDLDDLASPDETRWIEERRHYFLY
jgi:hypothetical protein